MRLTDAEHYDLMRAFERDPAYRGLRLDHEVKSLWARELLYQDGHVNDLFLAYRRGYAFGLAVSRA